MAAPSPSPILTSASRYTLAPGDNLVISGMFLANATRVEIGGVALSIVYNTARQIIVAVPSPVPAGICRVTTATGSGTLARAFRPEMSNSGPGGGPTSPPPPSPGQQGATAAAAYDAAYNAAKAAAESAYNAAGGDAGGTAAHVAAQTAAEAAARGAAGAGQGSAARRAAGAAYNDFKTSLLTTNNGPSPNPGINAEGGATGAAPDDIHVQGMQQLLATMHQWLQVLPAPLQTLAQAATGILQVALQLNARFPAQRGIVGGLWSTFQQSMNQASQDAFNNNGPSIGPRQLSPWQQRMMGLSEWAGKGIGDFAGKMGLVDEAGMVPPAMAGAIGAGVGMLLIGAINNVKGAFEAGKAGSEAYTNGIRSGYGAVEEAARDLTNRVISALMQPFGASGSGVAGGIGQLLGSMSSTAQTLADMGSGLRSTFAGLLTGGAALAAGAGGGIIGALVGGPIGAAIGAFIGAGIGLFFGKLFSFFGDLVGKGFEIIGKVAGEVLKVAGAAVEAFVKVLTDCTQAAMEFAHTARSIANRSGFSDGTAAGVAWTLQGLGLSSSTVRGMFGSAGDGQFNRALTGAAWGVRGMPLAGDFDANSYLSSIYERSRQLRQGMGPLGAQFQQMFLNSTGNGALLDAVNLSPTAFYERMNFAKQFPGMSGENVGRFEEDFGTLTSEWDTFCLWLKTSFGTDVLPTLKELLGGAVGWVKNNKDGILSTLKNSAAWVWEQLPFLILSGLKLLVVGASNLANILGGIMSGIGGNLPTFLSGVEALINAFRDLVAMGMGLAAVASNVAQHGWIRGLVGAPGAYAAGQAAFLQAVPAFNMNSYISPRQQILLGQQMQGWGSQLTGLGNSINGKNPNGSITDNWTQKLDALIVQFNPANRHQNNPILHQIAQNTAATAQNTASIGQQTGDAMAGALQRAIADIIGVSLRHSSRDLYYASRRSSG